jgi:hypothetical protein
MGSDWVLLMARYEKAVREGATPIIYVQGFRRNDHKGQQLYCLHS